MELFTLADSLEILDLSNNQLSSLPDNLADLHHLKILFCSQNLFTEVPTVLARCPKLEMIGFKSNQISHFPENALPLNTRWLILTDNQISQLPDSIGDLSRLQKCALSGNQIAHIPKHIADCQSLELLRISANQLNALPEALLSLPKLSWLAFSGNPLCQTNSQANSPKESRLPACVTQEDIQLFELIGEGASGLIHRAKWHSDYATPRKAKGIIVEKNIAVKLFKGTVTSDGYPKDELQTCLQAGKHPNLVEMLAALTSTPNTSDTASMESAAPHYRGMVMQLIPKKFFNLGEPPSLQTCTRDTFKADASLTATSVLTILTQVADTLAHLHQQGAPTRH